MNNYEVVSRIGQGAHGYVLKAVDKSDGRVVALKRVVIRTLDEGIPKNTMREITALRVLKSDYIVELLEVIPRGMGLVLVMEYLPLTLYDMLHDVDYILKHSEVKMYAKTILRGLKYMHENSIMHRDLKPANLLIDHNGKIKIADFGLARIYVENDPKRLYSHQVATRWYRAPELLYGSRNYTPSVDLWATGCIIAEMINKTPLFPGETDIEQLAIVLHTLGTPTKENWPNLSKLPDYNKIIFSPSSGVSWTSILPDVDEHTLDLVKSMVRYDQAKRPTAAEALLHDYFFAKPLPCPQEQMPKPRDLKLISKTDDVAFEDIISDCVM